MDNAITYKDLSLSIGQVTSIEKLEIRQRPNHHGELTLVAVLDDGPEEMAFYEMPDTVAVHYTEGDTEKILFKGFIANSSMERVGKHRKVQLKAYDATWLLDTGRRTRSFQNISRTSHSVVEEVMEGYPECICMKHIPKEPIGQIWFQYEETDWEFLCRFASRYSMNLYADATYHTARFRMGLSPQAIHVDWDNNPYRMGKDLERYDLLSQNGYPDISASQFVDYSIDSYDLYTLGSRLTFLGKQWYIGGLQRQLKEGILVNTYELRQKEAMLAVRSYNSRVAGTSQDGRVLAVKRDRVQVRLNADTASQQETYWFPFSTLAASSDGSGWYSMPEAGDSVRVYFPTRDEKEAYVVTKHDSHTPAAGTSYSTGNPAMEGTSEGTLDAVPLESTSEGTLEAPAISYEDLLALIEMLSFEEAVAALTEQQGAALAGGTQQSAAAASGGSAAPGGQANPMDDPSQRNIFTKDGNMVQMVPEGVILSAGPAKVSLLADGTVSFQAPSGIYINAANQIYIGGKTVTMEAGEEMKLENQAGSDAQLKADGIWLNGKEIYEN